MKLPYALARRFVAGETLEQALPTVSLLMRDGLHVTLDLLGEHVHDRETATALTATYGALIRRLAHLPRPHQRDLNISIKLSMLGQVIDADFCAANLRSLLTVAHEHGTFVRLDMEGSDLTQSTLDIFESVYPSYKANVGVVLQAMLRRTAQDVERMCALKARVRLCKGAYKEPESVAYQDMPTIRAHYLECMRELLVSGHYPGIATHDDELIDATKAFVQAKALPHSTFEFQMLYGIRPDTQRDLAQQGYNLRVYVPYGTEWFPYFYRRLRERKENVAFVLTNLFRR